MSKVTIATLTSENEALKAQIAALTAELEAMKSSGPKSSGPVKAPLDQYAMFLKAGVASAIDAKDDKGKRDWETLGVAINRFDTYRNPDLPTWNVNPFTWMALDGFSRFLALTGHHKSGWSNGGSRRIDGLKIPSSTGKAYDKKREAFARRMGDLGLTAAETITEGDATVRLAI